MARFSNAMREDVAHHAFGLVGADAAHEIPMQHGGVTVEDCTELRRSTERRRDHRGIGLVPHTSIFPAAAARFAVGQGLGLVGPVPVPVAAGAVVAVVGGTVVAVVGGVRGAVVTGATGRVATGVVSDGAGSVVLVVVAARRTVRRRRRGLG